MDPTPKVAPTFAQVYQSLLQILGRSSGLGCFGTLANWLFEPANPFDPNQRCRPRPELLILWTYVALMGATFAIFNLW
jgi:hypothetical protein